MPADADTEIVCSFLRNPHYASVVMTYDKPSKIYEANRTIEMNDANREPDKIKMKGAFDRVFSCALCMNGFVRRKAYDEHIRTCSGPKTTRYTFNEEEYTLFKDQNRTDPPPFDIFFDTETPIDDDKCTEPTLLLGSYAIVVVFSDNILASKDNSLQNFTCFRSKIMDVNQVTKQLVPNYMLSSIKEEDARVVYKSAMRVHQGIPCAFNELLFTDLQLISNTVKRYLFTYIMPVNRYLNMTVQQNYMKRLKENNVTEVPCYLCNLPVAFEGKHINATRFIAKVCHMKSVDRSIKNAIKVTKDDSDHSVELPHRT